MRFILKLAIVLVLALVASVFFWYRQTQLTTLAASVIPVKEEQQEPAQQESAQPRPVYPHSVVPGGVSSGKDLGRAIASDPTVAKHYAGIKPEKMRPLKLVRDVVAFVSFRINDKTYWTKRKVKLHKGELLFCDGENWVRGRCGNRIAFLPQRPFLPPADEPTENALDTALPEVPMQMADLGLVPRTFGDVPEPKTLVAGAERTQPDLTGKKKPQVLRAYRGPVPLPLHPFLPAEGDVPEPASILLVTAGLAGIAIWKSRQRAQ